MRKSCTCSCLLSLIRYPCKFKFMQLKSSEFRKIDQNGILCFSMCTGNEEIWQLPINIYRKVKCLVDLD